MIGPPRSQNESQASGQAAVLELGASTQVNCAKNGPAARDLGRRAAELAPGGG